MPHRALTNQAMFGFRVCSQCCLAFGYDVDLQYAYSFEFQAILNAIKCLATDLDALSALEVRTRNEARIHRNDSKHLRRNEPIRCVLDCDS